MLQISLRSVALLMLPLASAELACPPSANLEDPEQMDAMLLARASAQKDIVITILGPTTGKHHVRMGDLGQLMLRNMVANLHRVGVTNYLAISTHLSLPQEAGNNMCLSALRPAGICCGYSGVGMQHVHAGGNGRRWDVSETHPYMLFLQRWLSWECQPTRRPPAAALVFEVSAHMSHGVEAWQEDG